MRSNIKRLVTLFFTVVSVLLGSCEETQPRGDTGTAPVALAAFAEEAPEAWAYDARTGLWSPSVFTVVAEASELYRDGRLYRVTSAGLVDRGAVAPEALDAAEQTYVAEALHWTPGPDDWVLVLGAHDEAGHVPLRDVRPGDRFAHQGRIFETRASSAGSLDVRHTGEVLSSVEQTFVRQVHDVIDAAIQYADGTTETIRATPDHPFYLPSHRGYVDLRDVAIGSTLHVSGGGEALLVSKTWRQGDFEVFNFEVAEQHNYFVRASGSGQLGLLVHNGKYGKPPPRPKKRPYKDTDPGRTKPCKPGLEFTPAQKRLILAANRRRNGGRLKSDVTGRFLATPRQSIRGGGNYSPNGAQVDHATPKTKDGGNCFGNALVVEAWINRAWSNY